MSARTLTPAILGLALALAGCGRKSAQAETSGGSGGSGGSASATSTTGTSSTGTSTTGTSGTSSTTGTSTTATTGTTGTTSTTSTTGTGSSTGGSTGCDLMPVDGTGTAGTGGGAPNPYGPCESDEDCVTDYNLQWCAPGRCLVRPEGSVCMAAWADCVNPGIAPAGCPKMPEWMDCSEQAKNDPGYMYCAFPISVPPGDEFCDEEPDLMFEPPYCAIDCAPKIVPCPAGMFCSTGGNPSGVCVWPP